jgi:hypothetical protein
VQLRLPTTETVRNSAEDRYFGSVTRACLSTKPQTRHAREAVRCGEHTRRSANMESSTHLCEACAAIPICGRAREDKVGASNKTSDQRFMLIRVPSQPTAFVAHAAGRVCEGDGGSHDACEAQHVKSSSMAATTIEGLGSRTAGQRRSRCVQRAIERDPHVGGDHIY